MRLVGARVTSAVPVPLRAAVCGLLPAESDTVSVPVRLPMAVGVKVTLMVQEALLASVAAQLLFWAKSPEMELLMFLSVAPVVFVSVTGFDLLATPSTWLPNAREVGLRVALVAE